MDKRKVIEELLDIQIGYYNDREKVMEILEDQPVIISMLEAYTDRIDRITDTIVETILQIPNEPSNNKYEKDNLTIRVTGGLINYTVQNKGEYKNSVIEIILDWKNITEYTDKVITQSWFYHEKLLEEYAAGFPSYQEHIEKQKKSS